MLLNPFDLSSKHIMVTGASSGIGKTTAIYLSQLGARIVLIGRDQAQLEETLSCMKTQDHMICTVDLNMVDFKTFCMELARERGEFHGLFHAVGVRLTKTVSSTKIADFNNIQFSNVTIAFALIQGMIQKNVSAENASFVLMSSTASLIGQAAISAYSASKGAIISLSQSLAAELARYKIRVNAIVAGLVETKMTKTFFEMLSEEQLLKLKQQYLLGLGQPEDIAYAAAFLLSPASKWITGTSLVIDGGYSHCRI